MQFKFETQKLLAVLTALTKFTGNKWSENYQRLIRISATGATSAELYVDNGSTQAKATVELMNKAKKGETLILDVKILHSVITMLDSPEVTLSVQEKTVFIQWENGNASTALESDEFPVYPEMKECKTSTMKGEDFLTGVALTNPFVADDELRPSICAIQLVLGAQKEMVSTNSKTLMIVTIPFEGDEGTISLPSDVIGPVRHLIDKEQELKFVYDDNNGRLETGDFCITFHQRSGKYPNYRSVIPTDNPSELIVDKKALQDALKRLRVCSNKQYSIVVFELKNEIASTITVSSEDLTNKTKANQTLSCNYNGLDQKIGFRIDDMSMMLGVLQDERIVMKINDNRHPVIITCEDTEKYPAIGVIIPAIIR